MTKQKEARRVKIKYRVRNKISGNGCSSPHERVPQQQADLRSVIETKLERPSSQPLRSVKKHAPRRTSLKVGEAVAKKALEAGISEVVFDRNGYLYHGRVKEVAEGARKGGLKF